MHAPGLVSGLILLGLGVGCHREPDVAALSGSAASSSGRPVETIPLRPRPLDRALTVLGSFAPKQEAELSAKVSGRLKAIHVDLGSSVKAGQVLAEIEPRDYELRLLQAEAALAQARALLGFTLDGSEDGIDLEQTTAVREAKAVYEQARADRSRVDRLREEGILSSSEYDSVEASYQVAWNRYQAALEETRVRLASVAQRRVEIDIARQQLTDATLIAPFAGTVQLRQANMGQYLKVGDPILRLVQMDPLRLRLEVPEKEAVRVEPGQEVRFKVTGESQERVAQITRISPSLDRVSRVLVIEADVSNPGDLHPGSFAEASIVVQKDLPVLMVPLRALRTFAGIEKVFVAEEGVAAEKEVATGQRDGDWVEVITGLREGDQVILDPGNLRHGDAVKAMDAPRES